MTCSQQPTEQGVVAGMPLAEAQALVETRSSSTSTVEVSARQSVHFEAADPDADVACLRRIAHGCECFSPLVGLEESPSPESVLLDVTGCTHLFGGENGLAKRLISKFREEGLVASGSVAPTLGAAWATAHFSEQPTEPTVVHPKRLMEALSPLPIAALRLPDKTVSTLNELGLRTVGQLRALPRSTLPSRFGPQVLKRLDQAFGDEGELLVPQTRPEEWIVQWAGEWPLTSDESLRVIVRELLDELLSRLKPRRMGIRQLLCGLREPCGRAHEFRIDCVAPVDATRHLLELLSLQWERRSLPDEIVFVRLEATRTESLQVRQRDLFGHEIHADHQRDIVALLDRLSSRLGPQAVVRGRLLPEAQPELAVAYEPWIETQRRNGPLTSSAGQSTGNPVLLARPTHLLTPPQRIGVSIAGPEGAPLSFVWNRREHRVIRSWGPERIATGWWRDTEICRDYFRVETQTGLHFWLFHCYQEVAWFVQGAFD